MGNGDCGADSLGIKWAVHNGNYLFAVLDIDIEGGIADYYDPFREFVYVGRIGLEDDKLFDTREAAVAYIVLTGNEVKWIRKND